MAGQQPFQPSPNEPVFLGFAGHMGSGKTTAATYLSSKYTFQYTRYSQVLREWRSTNSQNQDRLQELGWDVMVGGLQRELNTRLITALDHSRSTAIDGLRHIIDVESLTSAFGASFGLIFLEANEERRWYRLRQRFDTLAAFEIADSHPVEANIDSLRQFAHLIISNDRSMENLCRQLDDWMLKFDIGSGA